MSYKNSVIKTQKKHLNLSKPSGSWVIGQNNILTVLIHSWKTAWPKTKILIPFLSFFGQYALRFSKKKKRKKRGLVILRWHTKGDNFKLGVFEPLTALWSLTKDNFNYYFFSPSFFFYPTLCSELVIKIIENWQIT